MLVYSGFVFLHVLNLERVYVSRNLSVSSRFSNLLAKSCSGRLQGQLYSATVDTASSSDTFQGRFGLIHDASNEKELWGF